jgi:hypothetical protein
MIHDRSLLIVRPSARQIVLGNGGVRARNIYMYFSPIHTPQGKVDSKQNTLATNSYSLLDAIIAITAFATTIAPNSPCRAEPTVPPRGWMPAHPEKLGPHREPYAGA